MKDSQAKKLLLQWPGRTKRLWQIPEKSGFWVRARPSPAKSSPVFSAPGSDLFKPPKTQPDGLWVFAKKFYADAIVIEVCGTIQNLNDKRSRYIPASHSLVLTCPKSWLRSDIALPHGGSQPVWKSLQFLQTEPDKELIIPVRFLRVLYALKSNDYDKWASAHSPAGYEFFCCADSLGSHKNDRFIKFLQKMSIGSAFYTKPYKLVN
jgi:hypothetical protein